MLWKICRKSTNRSFTVEKYESWALKEGNQQHWVKRPNEEKFMGAGGEWWRLIYDICTHLTKNPERPTNNNTTTTKLDGRNFQRNNPNEFSRAGKGPMPSHVNAEISED
jgi:hypothetical protein